MLILNFKYFFFDNLKLFEISTSTDTKISTRSSDMQEMHNCMFKIEECLSDSAVKIAPTIITDKLIIVLIEDGVSVKAVMTTTNPYATSIKIWYI